MNKSLVLFDQAQKSIPGGVNSPVRAFRGVDDNPRFIERGKGPYLYDVDGNQYIDYVLSWGPLILGHAHPLVLAEVTKQLSAGWTFGAPTEIEVKLAEKVKSLMPSIEKIRFVSTGTEAVMSAIRLARGYINRDKILKFAGCYHGHADSVLVDAGSGGLTFGIPSSKGVPESIASQTLVAQYNDIAEVEHYFKQYGDDIACIIIEPVAGNMNCVLPQPGFLQKLRELCDQYGALLIFDEVITGFRVALGGAQAYFNIEPDLTILGKIVGGGFPAAAFGGKEKIMNELAPLGPVYQAGTLSGNPIAMTAGLATLQLISEPDFFADLARKTQTLIEGFQKYAKQYNIPFYTNHIGGMFGVFFTTQTSIQNENDVKNCDINLFKSFFHHMLKAGIYLAPSAFEVGFMSIAHTDIEIAKTLKAAEQAFNLMQVKHSRLYG